MRSVKILSQNFAHKSYLALLVGLTFLSTLLKAQTPDTLCSEKWERTDWTNDWHVDAGTWEVGVPTSGSGKAYRGQKCAATVLAGNYSEPVATRLIRHTSFVVPSANQNPRLRFWHWFSFSNGDTGFVQLKVGTGDWSTTGKIIGGPYVNTSSGVWSYPSLDLSAYAGSTVQIAFYFKSRQIDYWNHDVSSGWYIDDVALIIGNIAFNNSENWESGIGDWYVDKGTWEVGSPTTGPGNAYTGQKCAATVLGDNYHEWVDTRLISPAFVVPSASQNPRLRFWHWFSFSNGDTGFVQIKVGTGQWKKISVPYTNTGSGVWTYPSLDLSAYSGSTIQIAFCFKSRQIDYWNWDVSSGWYIDDVAIITGNLVFNSPENWESGIGEWFVDKGTWEVGTLTKGPTKAHGGQKCAGTVLGGNYHEWVNTRLISPVFVVPSANKNPSLMFWHWYDFAAGDSGFVQIKVGSGKWQTILGPYKGTSSGVWTPDFKELSSYADSTVQIAFYFKSQQIDYWNWDVSTGWYIDDIKIDGLITGINETSQESDIIKSFVLNQNYPNPFNPETTILYALPRAGQVEVVVFDLLGKRMRTLVNQHQQPGQYKVRWDGRDENGERVSSGVYLYRLQAGNFVQTRKMVLIQ